MPAMLFFSALAVSLPTALAGDSNPSGSSFFGKSGSQSAAFPIEEGVIFHVMADKCYATLSDAMSDPDLKPGDELLIGAGNYKEDIRIDRGISLKGAAGFGTPRLLGRVQLTDEAQLQQIDYSQAEIEIIEAPALMVNAICRDLTLSVNASGELFITPEQVNDGSDTTGFASWEVVPDEFDCSHIGLGPQNVELTITDTVGMMSSCQSQVTVVDSIAPVVACKDTILYLDVSGLASVSDSELDDGSIDNCTSPDNLIFDLNLNNFTCQDVASTENFQAHISNETSGNQAWQGTLGKDFTVNREITVFSLGAFDDNQDGITGQYNGNHIRVAIMDRNTQTVIPGLDVEISGSGFVLAGGHRFVQVAPVTLPPGEYSVVAQGYHAGEQNGNSNFPGYSATVNEDAFGAVDFSGDNRYSNDMCCNFDYPTFIMPGSNTLHAGTFAYSARVGHQLSLYVEDESGNSSLCEVSVIVEDTIPPTMDCQDITVNLDGLGNAEITTGQIAGSTGDACEIDTMYLNKYSFSCDDIGQDTVLLYAEDRNGNLDSCEAEITVQDLLAPEIICPASITVNLDSAHCDRLFCYDIEVNDNCPGYTMTIPGFQLIGDYNGNRYFISNDEYNWEDGNELASSLGGHLVYLETEDESNWIRANHPVDPMNSEIWIGSRFNASVDDFKWNSGTFFAFESWASGQPGAGPFDREIAYWNYTELPDDGWYATADTTVHRRLILELEQGRAIRMITGIAPGNPFPFGETQLVYQITDAGGNNASCNFTVLVQSDDNVVCTEQNISLNEECESAVLAEMVLSGQVDCYDVYEVTVFDEYGNIIGDTVRSEHAGRTLTYEVNDVTRGPVCGSTILVEDKFPPILFCRDTVLNCIEMQQYNGPDVVEYCEGTDVQLVGEVITPRQCDEFYVKEIIRAYVATDAAGNVSDTCFQEILIERFPLDSVDFGDYSLTFSCDDISTVDQNDNPDPSITGTPTLYGESIYPYQDFLCNVTVSYSDYEYPEIACTSRIVRTWEVTEWWCSEKITRPFVQQIFIIDTTAPVIVVPSDFTVNTDRRKCEASFVLPAATVNDACHEPVSVSVQYPGGFLSGQNGGFVELPVGTHTIVYTAYDACYNSVSDSMQVTVRDDNPPVAVCEQHLVVSLRQDGTATVPAQNFDDGSYDPCGIDSIFVRRMGDNCNIPGNEQWGEEVAFCCADVGQGYVMVGLLIRDIGGNEAQCMVSVEVQDKYAPSVLPLPDMTISCEYAIDTTRLFEFGKIALSANDRDPIVASNMQATFSGPAIDGLAADNCSVMVSETFDLNIDNCGIGILKRYFVVSDAQGSSITTEQTITVVDYDPFDESDITWPLDLDTVGVCNDLSLHPDSLPAQYGRPQITGDDACSLVGINFEDRTLPIVQGDTACGKIIRTWTVIDWCQKVNGSFLRLDYEQIIAYSNNIAPVITSSCQDTMICTFDPECNDGFIGLLAEGTDDCTPSDQLHWQYEIDLADDGSIDIVENGNDASGLYPIGVHRITWYLEDRCGNSTSCEYTFEIRNCKGPVVYCRNGLVAAVEPVFIDMDTIPDDEQVIIYPENLDLGSHHPCGYPVELSFSQDNQTDSLIYNCDSLGNRTVEMWVTDINGNQGSCVVIVQVIDTNAVQLCPVLSPSVSISGVIANAKGGLLENVNVDLLGSGMPVIRTDDKGRYAFPGMPMGGSYQVMPIKDDDVLAGISTKDIIAIQRHLLGLASIEDPYALIAADVNKSNSISARDLTELRRVILGIQPTFSNNASWRFIESDYKFPDSDNPWFEKFPEFHDINILMSDEEVNFTGVKIGDVDQSLTLTGAELNSRSLTAKASIVVGVIEMQSEQRALVPISISSELPIEGLQASIDLNGLTPYLAGVRFGKSWNDGDGMIAEKNFYKGNLKLSWASAQGPITESSEPLLYIELYGPIDRLDVNTLAISTCCLISEAYTQTLESLPLELVIESPEKLTASMIVSPNPWVDYINVNLDHVETGEAVLMLFDQSGKQLWHRKERVVANTLNTFIRKNRNWQAGIYHLVFKQNDQIVTSTVVIAN